ncbi:MAG: VPS10 domain-containing protein [Actinomycetota bacterium]
MRLFLGGSNGLVLYEDEEITPLMSDPVLCLARPLAGRVLAGTAGGSIVRWDGTDGVMAAKDVGDEVTALAVGAAGQVLAGTKPAGAWTSKDGGGAWKELAGFQTAPGHEGWTSSEGHPSVSCVAVHPKHPKTIYAGVESGGIYRSRDGGKSWFDLGIPAPQVRCIQVSPARRERVYVTAGPHKEAGRGAGAWCTDDEGMTWRPMGTANPRRFSMGLAAHPAEIDRVILSASEDAPANWKGRARAHCDVYLSTDAGRRFRTVVKNLRGGVRRCALVINLKVPSEVMFGTSTGELWYSSDGGESFDRVADGLGDVFAIAFA